MKKIRILLLITATILTNQMNFCARYGVVIESVIDLVGKPLRSSKSYHHLPWAARGSDYAACPRIHQLLFHEIVEILDEHQDEVKVRIPNLFYQTANQSAPQTDYWTVAAAIRPLDTMATCEQRHLPRPIRFDAHEQIHKPVVTLLAPYYDSKTNMTFSAGTRFVRASRGVKRDCVSVYRFNPEKEACEVIYIPQTFLYQAMPHPNPRQQRADFIRILRSWAHTPGTIPYVWGGCSFTKTLPENRFTSVVAKQGGYYKRPGFDPFYKTGFDCAGLIARAAQIVGLPYFLKNSYTIAQHLVPLKPDEHLKPGDIISLPGHVMVISDTTNHQAIEAHAYGSGYGRVHELPMGRVLKGIETTADIQNASRNHRVLERLNSAGKVFARYPRWKLLKIPTTHE